MNDKKAELVTYICKSCQQDKLTFDDLQEIMFAVKRFYYENATP